MVSVAGRNVLRAEISENRVAAWTATVELDSEESLSGQATIDMDGAMFVGTVVQSDVEAGRCKALIVGGAGALHTILPAAHYYTPQVQDLLSDFARETGEVLDPDIAPSVLQRRLPRWSRLRGDAHTAVRQIADALEVEWRITRAGTLWLGAETWPTVDATYLAQEYAPELRLLSIAYAGDTEAPVVRPGTTFDGRRVERVVTVLEERSIRQDVYFDETKGEAGWMAAVARRIREIVGPKLALSRFYPGKVVNQHASGALTLMMDDPEVGGKWKGVDNVPVVFGLPGITAKISSGARVRVFWDGGDPSRARVTLFDQGAQVAELTLTVGTTLHLGGPASAGVARVGDTVGPSTALATWIANVAAKVNGVVPTPATPTTVATIGTITSGSAKVKSI